MSDFGRCELCGLKRVRRMYKLKDCSNTFRTMYPCQKSINHTYSEEELEPFDIAWHKKESERLEKEGVFHSHVV